MEWNKLEWEEYCYFKSAGHAYGDWPIHVYIFKQGIGIDVDYGCGGNSSNMSIKFKEYDDNIFEEAYDEMVKEVNNYRNR